MSDPSSNDPVLDALRRLPSRDLPPAASARHLGLAKKQLGPKTAGAYVIDLSVALAVGASCFVYLDAALTMCASLIH